jgi:outer membrane protein OmpA-like peptidoglycan-associated protein
VEYDKGDKPISQTRAFRLDVSAPVTEISLNPTPFSPDNDGVEDELIIAVTVTDPSEVAEWSMEITDPMGKHFTSFKGEGTPSAEIVWDGISDKGELVQAASDYKLKLKIVDTVGNSATAEKTIVVDVLVMRDGDKLYIRVPSITFKPDTADYKSVAKEALEKNLWTIQRLAVIFKKYRAYQIQIEGHAVSVYWRDPPRSEKEQVEELIPLSIKRAEAIKAALAAGGIDVKRISTVGIGASRPLFPFSDEENLWKNRRVEFILLK